MKGSAVMAKAAEEVAEEEAALRSQMWKLEAMVDWINETEGVELDTLSAAEIIAWANARRVAWRQTDTYRNLVAEHRTEAAAEATAAKAAAKAERDAKAAAKAAAEAAKAAAPAPAKAAQKATKATAAKKAPAKAAAAKKAPAKKASSDNPFE
jgi:hypothetical protein